MATELVVFSFEFLGSLVILSIHGCGHSISHGTSSRWSLKSTIVVSLLLANLGLYIPHLSFVVVPPPLFLFDSEILLKSGHVLTEINKLRVFVTEHLGLIVVSFLKLLGSSLRLAFCDHQILESIGHLDQLFGELRLVFVLPLLKEFLLLGRFCGQVDVLVHMCRHIGSSLEVQLFQLGLVVSQLRDVSVKLLCFLNSEEHVLAG